jgi:mono/diheme cytochrome c family protein
MNVYPKLLFLGSLLAAPAVAVAVALFIIRPVPPFAAGDPRLQGNGEIENGRLIFAAGDCGSCHASPGQPDKLKLGGGLALASPFGTFRPPNISPDPVDGIGRWTAVDLANALIGGVSTKDTHYYPVFPYTSYTGMTLGDVRDLFVYLRTLPPVAGRPPPHDMFFLFRIRTFVGLWKMLFFQQQKSPGTPDGDPVRERGRYLVETITHCAECHSSRNLFGAIKSDTRFAGGIDPAGTSFVPNITPSRIGHWSERDIAELLISGKTPDHGRVGSSMIGVVTNTAMLPQADREAIARYIKSLPRRPTPRP